MTILQGSSHPIPAQRLRESRGTSEPANSPGRFTSTVYCGLFAAVRRMTTNCQRPPTVRTVIRPAPCPVSLVANDGPSRRGGSGSTARRRKTAGQTRNSYPPVRGESVGCLDKSRNAAPSCRARLEVCASAMRRHGWLAGRHLFLIHRRQPRVAGPRFVECTANHDGVAPYARR